MLCYEDGSMLVQFLLTHKHLEMHWCIVSTVATDALVHQANNIHSAVWIFIILDQFLTEISQFMENMIRKLKYILKKKMTQLFKG